MNSFTIGFLFIGVLILFTLMLGLFAKTLPKEFILIPTVIMIFGDGIFVAIYYYALKDIAENIKEFKLGIALSFMLMSFVRAIFMALAANVKIKFE